MSKIVIVVIVERVDGVFQKNIDNIRCRVWAAVRGSAPRSPSAHAHVIGCVLSCCNLSAMVLHLMQYDQTHWKYPTYFKHNPDNHKSGIHPG